MRRAFLVLTAVVAMAVAASGRADALEFNCIEASRYRHLYQLFGGDPKQLAAFLGLEPAALPKPEFCRAILISGKVEPRAANDADKLISAIEANQGWLATLQLSSSGGTVYTGYQLGFITRMFWLKTHTATRFGKNLNYVPDFFVPPAASAPDTGEEHPDADRIRNWQSFVTAQKGLSPTPLAFAGCASACGLIHTAGIDRAGEVRVHRARITAERRIHQSQGHDVGNRQKPAAPRARADSILSADGPWTRFRSPVPGNAGTDDHADRRPTLSSLCRRLPDQQMQDERRSAAGARPPDRKHDV